MILLTTSRFFTRLRFLFPVLILFLASAKPAHAQATNCASQGVSSSTTGSVTWTPQWCQEFNATTAGPPDTTVWTLDLGGGGWGNGEAEVYCGPPGTMSNPSPCPTMFSTTTNTVYLDGSGHLVIQALNNGTLWTSARMKTEKLQSFSYGRIEASIQLPDTTNQGLWPAFWSLGTSITNGTPWPNCGEADIMEDWSPSVFNGPGPNGNRATIHTAVTGGNGKGGSFTFPSGQQANTAFHTYGVIWSANLMQYYVDDPTKPFFVVTPSDLASNDTWPFNASIFLITNVAVGGTLGGSTTSLVNPQPMMFDYIRQYTPSTVPAPSLGNPPSITVKAGATYGNTSTFTPSLTAGTGFVYFTCSTNAPKSSCALSTNDLLNAHVVNSSPTGAAETVTVTITTTANAMLPPLLSPPNLRLWLPIAILGILLLVLAFVLRKVRPAWRPACVLAGLILAVALIAGCGGGYGGGYTPPPPSGGTTPGSYQITVNAFTESNTSGNADASTQITLTVN